MNDGNDVISLIGATVLPWHLSNHHLSPFSFLSRRSLRKYGISRLFPSPPPPPPVRPIQFTTTWPIPRVDESEVDEIRFRKKFERERYEMKLRYETNLV